MKFTRDKLGSASLKERIIWAVVLFMCLFFTCVVLGTWSFSVESTSVPLFARFLRTFDLAHRAGFWELLGQLLIACATAHISIILTNGKNTDTKKIRSIHLLKSEQVVFALGVVLMSIVLLAAL